MRNSPKAANSCKRAMLAQGLHPLILFKCVEFFHKTVTTHFFVLFPSSCLLDIQAIFGCLIKLHLLKKNCDFTLNFPSEHNVNYEIESNLIRCFNVWRKLSSWIADSSSSWMFNTLSVTCYWRKLIYTWIE